MKNWNTGFHTAAFMKEGKFKAFLTKQLLSMFKLRCELGFILNLWCNRQFFFNSCRNKLRDKLQEKMPSVPKPLTEFPPLQFRGMFFNDNTDNWVEGKFTSTRIKKKARESPSERGTVKVAKSDSQIMLPDLVSHSIFGKPPPRKRPTTESPQFIAVTCPFFKDPFVRILPWQHLGTTLKPKTTHHRAYRDRIRPCH